MNKTDILTINLDSNAFAAMKSDFNTILKRTLGNMQLKESNEATMTLKLNITLDEVDVRDFDAQYDSATKKVIKPTFVHKVSSVMQIKSEESGSFKGEYELVWDDETQEFVMRPIYDGQTSIFDTEDSNVINADYTCEDDEIKALPTSEDEDYEYDGESEDE